MINLKAGRHSIEITNPDKVLFPGDKITKLDVAEYYRKVARQAVPYMKKRPLNMHRFPDGISKPGFIQQEIGKHFPKWIERLKVKKTGGTVTHVLCSNPETLVYLAQEASIENHVWLSKAGKLDYPDRIIFDLDPGRGGFRDARFAALKLKQKLDALKMKSAVMTTGSRGYHVIVPLKARRQNFDAARKLARGIADELAEKYKDKLTTEQRKNKRRGRVYIDTNRNAYGQTAVAPYSVRAKKGAPVATPLSWNELEKSAVNPQKYGIKNLFRRRGNPWRGIS